MRLLVYGDLHLKPNASDYDIAAMVVPDEADGALILGDLTHRAGPEDVELASRFVDQFGPDVPVVYIPGNHDHAPTDQRVVDSRPWAQSGHNAVRELGDVTVVGLGCEQRSLMPAIDQCSYTALDPRDVPPGDRRYAADQIAEDIEVGCYNFICGSATREEVADSLEVATSERSSFYNGLQQVEEEFETISVLLRDHDDVLLATHVPPFNTSFDRHHAVGSREKDQEYLHVGSIAIKLAIREHDVLAALSGHSHTFGYDVGDGRNNRPHLLNLGYRGMGEIRVDPSNGNFGFTRLNAEGSS